jgi:uncharacterized membrane protein YccC
MIPVAMTRQSRTTTTLETLRRALREASVTMLAALATLACALAIAPGPGPAVLSVVLCLSLSRSQLDRDLRGRIEAAIALPVVGLVAVGVGTLLQRAPWLGALVFVGGMFISIWLRRFGAAARRAGSLIALPFVVLLATPPIHVSAGSAIPTPLVPILVGLLALLCVGVLHTLARRWRFLPPANPPHRARPAPIRDTSLRPMASTRMAIQMAAALAASFIVGYVFFPQRWAWIVLTAFIVLSGNRGRLDVAHKSVLRVLGAAAGTALALTFTLHAGSHDASTVALILAAVFLGVWLRPLGYAWWALFATVALALLQGFAGTSTAAILWPRLEEIAIGAIIGLASAWFVLPVRSTMVLRRRVADALAALAVAMDPAAPSRSTEDFSAAIAAIEQLAPAFRASRLATRRFRAVQPADWVDVLLSCRAPALALIENGGASANVRRAIGTARKSLREPAELLSTLHDLRRSLTS